MRHCARIFTVQLLPWRGVFVQHPVRARSALPISLVLWSRSLPAAAAAPHARQRTHTLGYLLDSFSQLLQFRFSDIRITDGVMCLMRKALLIEFGQKWFESNLTRSGSLIDVNDNDNDDAICSSVGRSRCFACLLGGKWKNQQCCSLKQSQKMIVPRVWRHFPFEA